MDITTTPHLDPAWVEEFLIANRLHGSRGDAIGAALAEIDAHCFDSGEGVWEAFGDPAAYARGLALPIEPTQTVSVERALPPVLLGLAGMQVFQMGFWSYRMGEDVGLTLGMIVAGALLCALAALLTAFAAQVVGWLARRRILAALLFGSLVVVFFGVMVVAQTVVLRLPALPAILVGAALLAANVVWERRRLAGTRNVDVVGPGGPGTVGSQNVGALERRLQAATPYLFVVLTALVSLPVAIFG
jgi:hypothetical protein